MSKVLRVSRWFGLRDQARRMRPRELADLCNPNTVRDPATSTGRSEHRPSFYTVSFHTPPERTP